MESISPFSGKRKVSLPFRRSSVLSLFPSRLSRSRSPSKITLILFFGLFFVEDREFECLGWELHVILSYRVGDTLAVAEPVSIQYLKYILKYTLKIISFAYICKSAGEAKTNSNPKSIHCA